LDIHLKGIYKSFDSNEVLKGIDLSVHGGEIVALAGENGAGKSTLMKILSGSLHPDSGHIEIDGKPVLIHEPHDAMNLGIRMIYQELNLIRDLSVAENLFLVDEGRQYGRFFSQKKKMIKDTSSFLEEMGLKIDPQTLVEKLNIAQQQMVEISKSLVKEVKLLIMDEPTAALNKEETDQLFKQIRQLKKRGISVIYISHRLEEIFELADRVVILRDGQVVLQEAIKNVNQEQLVTSMVGKQLVNFYPKERNTDKSHVRMQVKNLNKVPYFQDISFSVYKGEVLGISGLMGSGKSEILRALFGLMKPDTGSLELDGKVIHNRSPKTAIKQGVVFLTADRKEEGLILDMSIQENLTLASLNQFAKNAGIVDRKKEHANAKDLINSVKVKTASSQIAVRHLSGGNQQKVVFGKWMMTQPKLFIMEEPTRGVDVGAKSELYRLINELTSQGISIIMVSSDIPEIVAMSDRVIVLRKGKQVQELEGEEITQHNILHASIRGAVG
jgi:ribose transport system ATP-binding protein